MQKKKHSPVMQRGRADIFPPQPPKKKDAAAREKQKREEAERRAREEGMEPKIPATVNLSNNEAHRSCPCETLDTKSTH